MKKDTKVNIPVLKVDGGAANNDYLMQFQADILNTPVQKAPNLETTALGAAFLAGLAVGYWKNIDEIKDKYANGKKNLCQRCLMVNVRNYIVIGSLL